VNQKGQIWFDGKLVNWNDARVHVLTHTLHYGLGVFEGIRFYKCDDGRIAVFRLEEHVNRLFDSAQVVNIEIPYSKETISSAIKKTIIANGIESGYIRPIAFIGDGAMGLYAVENPIHVAIAVWEWGPYLGDKGVKEGIKAKVSSYTRHHVNASMTKAKICGYYVNSILAKREVIKAGYDEAILLDTEGYVAEASGENVFAVKDGILKTTPPTAILPGITRDSIIKIAKDLKIEVKEERFTRDEVYIADEVFLTGTAAEITPVVSVDDRKIGTGKPGKVTKQLQNTFFEIIRGKNKKYSHWLNVVK
jgi:branched-chain amino acid aminotransferase